MKISMKKRVFAILLAVLMVFGLMPGNMGLSNVKAAEGSTYVLESKDLTAVPNKNTYADGDTVVAGTDNYFTLYMSANTRVDSSSKTWEDGYTSGQRINFGGKSDAATPKNIIKFTTKAAATVKVWWASGGKDRYMGIYNSAGTVISETSETIDSNLTTTSTFEIEDAGTYFLGNTVNNNYIFKIEVVEAPVGLVKPEVPGNGKIDVLDFGLEKLDETKYNNILTADMVNAIYTGVTPGTVGPAIPGDFSFKDAEGKDFFTFCAGGKTNNRWRTTNASITHYDDKSLKDKDGVEYTGYIYSNSGNTDTVYMTFYLYANDILKVWVGSNGAASKYTLMGPDGSTQVLDFTNAAKIEELTFNATEEGTYKLWCSANEKLVVARATREHTNPVKVSGTVTYNDVESLGVAAPTNYKVAFTNKITGAVTTAKVDASGNYEVYLYDQYSYKMTLDNANGYVINLTDPTLNVPSGSADITNNLEVKPVKVATATGKLTGLSAEALSKIQLNFISDNVYVPEITIDRTTGDYSLSLEEGVEYTVEVVDANDYTIANGKYKVTAATSTADIAFNAKPAYSVTINLVGISAADKANALITFTNNSEKYSDGKTPYTYTFKATDDIKLRDGQYSVKVSGLGNLAIIQAATADVKIDGAGTSRNVKFNPITKWDFAVLGGDYNIDTIGSDKYFLGLPLSSTGVAENKEMYLLAKENGVIKVPVTAGDVVTIGYCYHAAFEIDGVTYTTNSGSTSKIETVQVAAKNDGYMTITTVAATDEATGGEVKETYFTSITVTAPTEYTDTLYVGPLRAYKTINAALDAVAAMSRPNNERVTIMIDPGNYEEMLVINDKNITLKNASKTPTTDLKDKGVNIDGNAVRITSYYGHGYTYYSMGKDCKYDEALLAANKANGSASFTNPGTGTTSGSYWNATVVVYADGFAAEDIIFENSFNQYVSEKAANDVIVAQQGAKEGSTPRAKLEAGSTKVQEKEYVERAAAFAIANNVIETDLLRCKFIGRQDTLYGGTGTTAVFEECAIYGGTDYIMGGMTALFYKCDLVANTNDQTSKGVKDDNFYITAPQQKSGRGYLMYECTVTSTTPGVDTASTMQSKPGYWGRPWEPNSGEAVFYNTIVEKTNFSDDGAGTGDASLIVELGWLDTLSGKSSLCGEYGTNGSASDNRATWATVFEEPVLADGTPIAIESFVEEEWLLSLYAQGRLGYELADYSAVNAAIAAANALNPADYTNFDAVQAAIDAVVKTYSVDDQAKVDAMAAAITAAIANLEKVAGSEGPETPDTGDHAPILPFAMVAMAAGVAVVGLAKKKEEEE